MLLGFWSVKVEQDSVVRAARVVKSIKKLGMTIGGLGKAANVLAPELEFWYKHNSSVMDLSLLINEFKCPVGVEWQGLFEYPDSDEVGGDDDDGHYSIVTAVDVRGNLIRIADPYKTFAGRDRRFSVLEFERRWWDINTVINPKNGRKKQVDDYHSMFVVVKPGSTFVANLGMTKFA